MSKLSYKSLFIIFFFLLIGVVILSRFILPNKTVSASWWNESWSYRKAISLTNSSGSDLTDFQVSVSIGTSQLIADGKMQSNCDDIRFTDINGNLLPYWTQSNYCNTDNTVIWIKANLIPSSGSTVYLYYGNPNADSNSDSSWMPTGGTITQTETGIVQSFTQNDTFQSQANFNADILVVAGGGAGGSHKTYPGTGTGAGGGGAGGLIFQQNYSINLNDNFDIEIGIGGTSSQTYGTGGNGFNSIFNGLVAIGGGGGGGRVFNPANGGSGGGVGYNSTIGGIGTSEQGNNGGSSNSAVLGGAGGGGVGETGYFSTSNAGTNGGNGLYLGDIFTNSFGHNGWFAGGGGGGAVDGNSVGIGGSGGGGNGGVNSDGISAISNTGGGGGGSGDSGWAGGDGGSGIILIKYPSSNISISSNIQSEEIGGGPIAYWKFDEGVGTTTYDSSSNQNNGVISDATWQSEDQCISGKCLDFSGSSQFTNIANSSSLNTGNDITLSAWIYWHGGSGEHNIITKENAYEFRVSGGYINFAINPWSWYGGTSAPISENKWEYVVITHDSDGQQKIYINGIEKFSRDSGGAIVSNSNVLTIGARSAGTASFFNGLIDEVKIYPYARTADQIKLDYNSRGSTKGTSVNLGVKSNTAPSLKSSLVAHYKFDENQGTIVYDSSSNNKNGNFGSGSSSPTWSQNGKFKKAISFDGGDSILLANEILSTSSIRTNGVTYSAWVKPTTTTGIQKIVGQKPSSGYSDFASGGIDISSGKARMIAYDDNIAYKYATGNTTLNSNQWYHITGVYNASDQKIKIYVNGLYDGNETSITTFNRLLSNDSNTIGYQNHSTSPYFFNGLIDEVKIYNTALTPEEIKQDYNANSAIQFGSTNQTIGGTTTSLEYCIPGDTSYCAPPVAEWKMDEGIGTSTVDTSGNNKNGTFNNSPTWAQGKIGKALNFSYANNNSVTTTFNSQLTSYTAEAWIKPTGFESGNLNTIMATSSSYALWFELTSSSEISAHAFTTSTSAETATNGANIEIGKWYHVAVSATQNGTATIYVNGIGLTSFTAGNDNWSSSDVITIGDLRASRNLNFNGTIDHVKIYDYARTPAQIAYDYNKGGPIGWWKFDECQGNIAYDWSGVGNTGVINIGSSGSQNSLGTCQVGTSAAWTNGTSGKINSSLNFDGIDDYVRLGTPSIMGPDGITFSTWIKPTVSKTYNFIIGKGNMSSGNSSLKVLGLGLVNNYLRFFISQGDSSGWCTQPNQVLITNNIWSHVTGTFNKGTQEIKLYVNGIQKYQASCNQTGDSEGSEILFIGDDSTIWWPNGFFGGQIDDSRIYNYPLTSEQIKQIYNGGAVNFN